MASLTISGLISSGRMSAGDIDSTLLIVLAILETAGYLYGLIAISSGASQTCPEEVLLEGKGMALLRKRRRCWAGNGSGKDNKSSSKILTWVRSVSRKRGICQAFNQPITLNRITMIKMIVSFISLMTVWLFGGLDWLSDLFTAHNLANIVLVILGIIIASAASQMRLVLEKVENILSLYAKYTHPDSEDGKKLSEAERQRLFDLFLRELGSLVFRSTYKRYHLNV